ncbi:MAG: hypothetical protein HRU09_17135 [Oligoflexales bacterium]|nr:hypothetical protein [Oligoflexales bacterium]
MVPNVNNLVIILFMKFSLLTACGEPSSEQTQNRQNRKSSGQVVTSSASAKVSPLQHNSSDAHREVQQSLQDTSFPGLQDTETEEEDIPASPPAVISGAHLTFECEAEDAENVNCSVSDIQNIIKVVVDTGDGEKHTVTDGNYNGDDYEFSLNTSSNPENFEAEVHVLETTDVLEKIGNIDR